MAASPPQPQDYCTHYFAFPDPAHYHYNEHRIWLVSVTSITLRLSKASLYDIRRCESNLAGLGLIDCGKTGFGQISLASESPRSGRLLGSVNI
jgi:hypothetical protein